MSSPEQRVAKIRDLLEHARERIGLDLGFVLWDGSTVPKDLAPDAFAVKFADENVVAALLRSPKLETLAHLWVARRIDHINGTLFDVAHVKRRKKTREFVKTLDKGLILRSLLPFLFLSRGGPWPLDQQARDRENRGDPGENQQNIAYHYDVSNDFYALWLDKEMVYTCAYCTDWGNDVDRMQQDKLEMICRKLRLKPGEHMLDVGCGWGAVSMYAAQHYGVTAYGATLSVQQVEYANEKIKRLGLQDKVKIELKDYSLIEGEGVFDKIASIGIQEHIGVENYPKYYDTMKRLLKTDGLFLHHAIMWPGKQKHPDFRRRRKEGKLFNKYVFPGGDLDYIGNVVTMMERHGFEVHDVEAWREHYQRTCRHWHDRLVANYDKAVAMIGEPKTRIWLAYLAGSSIMFERNVFGLYQTLASKRRKGPSGLPPTRADLYR